MVKEVTRAGVTWQTGSQQRSDVYFREAAEFVRNQRLGKLQVVKVGLPGDHKDWNTMAQRTEPEPVPEGFNWDFWEGPAPHRDYRPALHPLNWRHNYDYSGGMVTDFGAHHIDIAQWALDTESTGPVLFDQCRADLPPKGDLYNTAKNFYFECTYANGLKMIVSSDEAVAQGVTFIGEDGRSIEVTRRHIKMNPPELRRDRIRDDEIRVYKSTDHIGNFIDCIYSGEPTVAPIEAAHRTISISHLANIAIRLGRTSLKWNPTKERIEGDKEAHRMLSRPVRKEWKLV
jgi:predicted dehydrogenase